MYFCTSSPPLTRMNVQSVWWATARASSVLPADTGRPGGQGKPSDDAHGQAGRQACAPGSSPLHGRSILRNSADTPHSCRPPTSARRAVQQHALWLRDAQGVKQLGVLQRQLDDLRKVGGRWGRVSPNRAGQAARQRRRRQRQQPTRAASAAESPPGARPPTHPPTHLLDLLDLLVQPSHHVVGGVGHLLNLWRQTRGGRGAGQQ